MLRERFRAVELIAAVVADTHASRRPSDEDDGKGHFRCILQQSCVSICGQEGACEQGHRKCLIVVLPRNKFQSLLSKSDASDSRFCLFLVNSCDPSLDELFFCLAQQSYPSQHSHISFFFDVSVVPLVRMVSELLGSLGKCRLHRGWTRLQAVICSM